MHPQRVLSVLSAVFVGCLARGAVAADAPSPRRVVELGSDWKFVRQDVPGAEAATFDDAAWQAVTVPHTWNAQDGQDGGNNYYRGPGWYRRRVRLHPAAVAGKSVLLWFDGAATVADVYVNGKPAGTHNGGFAAFCFDVTPLLDPAGDNVVAVKVSNAKTPDVAPLSGDFTIFGGIYRDARLVVVDELAIASVEDASPGVYVAQKSVTAASAELAVTTTVRNAGAADKTAALRVEVLDAGGATVASITPRVTVGAGKTAAIEQAVTIPSPHLWNGLKDPYLYHVRATARDGDRVADVVTQPLGLRSFKMDPDKGFLLNGEPYPLRGVNRHQDRIDKGWAIGAAEHDEDFAIIKEMGCTAVRLAHYQHSGYFYGLCDQGGVAVWAEVPNVDRVGGNPAFGANAKQQLRELIRQNYNHPSIVCWSLFNELRYPAADARPWAIVPELNALAHELDPTRPTVAASDRPAPHPINGITDAIAFNRYSGWYEGQPGDWGNTLDAMRAGQPGRAVAVAEYGAGASVFQHQADPTKPAVVNKAKWHPEDWQNVVHENAYRAMAQRPWLWGTFVWNMFDFAVDNRDEGDHPGRNNKGLVTYDRKTRKDAFYFYRANWSDEPVLYVTDRRFTPRSTPDVPVKVYSNCDAVELSVNGKSLGTQRGDGVHVFLWPGARLTGGENRIEVSGTRGGSSVRDACTIVYDPKAPTSQQAPAGPAAP